MSHVRHFVVDECDKCLENIDMRADVQVRGSTGRRGTRARGGLGSGICHAAHGRMPWHGWRY